MPTTTATTVLPTPLPEASDYVYAPTEPLEYEDGTPVVSSHIDTFTVTVTDIRTGTEVRAATPVLTATPTGMGGSLSNAGVLRCPLYPADTLGIGTARLQKRRVVFQVTTTSGRRLNWAIVFVIDNYAEVAS
jgi:hypothetical protein